MVTSDFRSEVEIWPFRACAMHPAGHNYWNSLFIVNLAMGQIPRSTERILVVTPLLVRLYVVHLLLAEEYKVCVWFTNIFIHKNRQIQNNGDNYRVSQQK